MLALASVASLMVALDTLVVTTALTTIKADLGASIEQLEWTVNAYNLGLAVLLMTAAALGDRLGRRRMFVVGIAVFVAASAACALSDSVGALIAARAVQGVGAALVLPLSLAIVSAAYPPEKQGAAIGILMGVTGLSVASGPVIGGAIAQGIAWEWIFWINVPLGLVLIPFVLTKIRESHGPEGGLDVPGLGLATLGALGLVWGLVRGNAAGWGSLEVLGTLVAGAVVFVAFVVWERRAREPMLPISLFASRAFSAGNSASFLGFAALTGAVFFVSQFLQFGLGNDPLDAGLRQLPWTATLFICAPIAGPLTDRYGPRPFMIGGLLLQAIGMGWMALVAAPDMAYGTLIAPMILAGCGISMSIPGMQSAVVGAVPRALVGKAAGANTAMRQLGGVFGVAIAVAVFSGAGGYASAQAFSDGFVLAIAVCAGLSLAGALASLALEPEPKEDLVPALVGVVREAE